jgi:AraC family transcriptional regulator
MNYKIVEKPAFQAAGKTIRVSATNGEHVWKIPEFWRKSMQGSFRERLTALSSTGVVLPSVLLGICMDFSADYEEFTYMIAAENANGSELDGLLETTVPGNVYAMFESCGVLPVAIQAVWKHIYSEFFPTAPYRRAPGPDLEIYPEGDPRQPDYRCEVWIPVANE